MPTYDYKCTKCSHVFELFQSMKDDPIKNCPECGGEVKRLIGTGSGAIFKGTGFYQTDYKNTSKSSSEKEKSKESNAGKNIQKNANKNDKPTKK